MKIVCISTSRVPSNTANSIQVMKACQALVRNGHTVHLFIPAADGANTEPAATWEELADRYGLKFPFQISWLPSKPGWKHNDFALLAVRKAVEMDIDLVYTWTGQSSVFALLHRLPVVYELHDLPTGILGPLWFRAFNTLPGRKRLAIITHALHLALQRRFGSSLYGTGVVIAPNGVDIEQYESLPDAVQARCDLGFPEELTVLCSGHLYSGRGVDLFLDLAKRFPQISFVWVGGRLEDVQKYQFDAQADGLSNVIFTGFVPQSRLPGYQAAADILLMPYAYSVAGSSGGNSANICSPMKMFDYLASRRVILSSDLPVIHEVLNDSNAFFAAPENLESWSEKLSMLIADAKLREKLSLQAWEDALAYSWQARAERILIGF